MCVCAGMYVCARAVMYVCTVCALRMSVCVHVSVFSVFTCVCRCSKARASRVQRLDSETKV